MVRAPAFQIGAMNLRELRELLVRVDAAIEERKVAEQKALRDQIDALARQSGYSLEELFGEPEEKGRKKAK